MPWWTFDPFFSVVSFVIYNWPDFSENRKKKSWKRSRKICCRSAKEKERTKNKRLWGLRKFATQIRVLIKAPRGRGEGKNFLLPLFGCNPRNVTFCWPSQTFTAQLYFLLLFRYPNNLQKSRLNSSQQIFSMMENFQAWVLTNIQTKFFNWNFKFTGFAFCHKKPRHDAFDPSFSSFYNLCQTFSVLFQFVVSIKSREHLF